jgi:hypothetical protein
VIDVGGRRGGLVDDWCRSNGTGDPRSRVLIGDLIPAQAPDTSTDEGSSTPSSISSAISSSSASIVDRSRVPNILSDDMRTTDCSSGRVESLGGHGDRVISRGRLIHQIGLVHWQYRLVRLAGRDPRWRSFIAVHHHGDIFVPKRWLINGDAVLGSPLGTAKINFVSRTIFQILSGKLARSVHWNSKIRGGFGREGEMFVGVSGQSVLTRPLQHQNLRNQFSFGGAVFLVSKTTRVHSDNIIFVLVTFNVHIDVVGGEF